MTTERNGDPEVAMDGRRRRGEDNRARIVAALHDLIRDGEYAPGAEQVAVRADVSLRTVFRHFEDMERLFREVSRAIEAELLPVATQPFQADDWQGRVVELVGRRAAAYERITPFMRAAEVHKHRSPFLEKETTRFAGVLRALLQAQLPSDKADRLEALDLLLSYQAWVRLRREQMLDVAAARAVVEQAVARQVAD